MLGRPEAQSTFRTPGPIARSLTQTRQVLEFKCTKTEEPHPISLPVSAIAALDDHRKVQDEFRHQYGPDYRADLNLIFAKPDGSPFKPDSISAAVSLLFRRLKLPKGEPALAEALALLALVGQRRAVAGGVGTAGAWVDTHDAGDL